MGGPFEVYPGEDDSQTMVIMNSNRKNEPMQKFKPIGAFYCNYMGAGIISLDDGADYDSMPSAKEHIKTIKQVIDILLEKAYLGARLEFPEL